MSNRKEIYRFEPEVLVAMDKFESEFLSNKYRKDMSENKGPNYREKIMSEDQKVFFDYLESDYSEDFLNLR